MMLKLEESLAKKIRILYTNIYRNTNGLCTSIVSLLVALESTTTDLKFKARYIAQILESITNINSIVLSIDIYTFTRRSTKGGFTSELSFFFILCHNKEDATYLIDHARQIQQTSLSAAAKICSIDFAEPCIWSLPKLKNALKESKAIPVYNNQYDALKAWDFHVLPLQESIFEQLNEKLTLPLIEQLNWKKKGLNKSEVFLGFPLMETGTLPIVVQFNTVDKNDDDFYYACDQLQLRYKTALLHSILSNVIPQSFLDFVAHTWDNNDCSYHVPNQVSLINVSSKLKPLVVYEDKTYFEDVIAFTSVHGSTRLNFYKKSTSLKNGNIQFGHLHDTFNESNFKTCLFFDDSFSLILPPKCLLIIKGDSRFEWGYNAVPFNVTDEDQIEQYETTKKLSLLLVCRTVKEKASTMITSQMRNKYKQTLSMKKDNISVPKALMSEELSTSRLERDYVYDVYDRIACHFSHTRHSPWPRITALLHNLPKGSVVIDVGCGNGKYALCNKDIVWIGSDRSSNLLHCCMEKQATISGRKLEIYVCDCTRLNLRENIADVCMAIAVLHHLPNEAKRLTALIEMLRCVKVGGLVLIYVWALEQTSGSVGARHFESQDVFVPWHLQEHLKMSTDASNIELTEKEEKNVKQNNENKKDDDIKGKLETVYRYYHVFTRNEIENLFNKINGCKIHSIDYDANNWAVTIEKTANDINVFNE